MLGGVAASAIDDVLGGDHGVQNEAAILRQKLVALDLASQQMSNGIAA
jgi:hypothetical protein